MAPCWWHCWWVIQISRHASQQGSHSILQRHAIPSGVHLMGTPNTPPGYVRAIGPKKENDGALRQMTWPPPSPDLDLTETVWGELDRGGKEKQPTSAQHLWELLQDCVENHSRWLPREDDWANAKELSPKQNVATLKNVKYKTCSGLFNTFLFTP